VGGRSLGNQCIAFHPQGFFCSFTLPQGGAGTQLKRFHLVFWVHDEHPCFFPVDYDPG
jgi:hypothetical protein